MIKEIIDQLINITLIRGLDCNTIILDRGTQIDFEDNLRDYYNKNSTEIEFLNLQYYKGYRIETYKGSNKVYIHIK